MSDYSYQIHSANQVLKNALKFFSKASVLAAAPGSGKTTISQIVISKYLKKFPQAKVLVLTHGQTLLKDQYIDSLNNPNVEIDFTYGAFDSDAQVRVGLPQSIKKLEWNKVDLLVVDECHEFYLRPMVQGILRDLKPTHQVLLTGSPSEFNRLKKEGKKYEITYICGNDLMDNNVFSNVEMDVVPIKNKKNAKENLCKMLDHAKRKGEDLSKIMVAVKTIKDANIVSEYLKSIGRNVALSTSKDDRNNLVVNEFKAGKFDALVVVCRGILGFSDNNITGLFDLRRSSDVDISNQLFARVLRKHPNNVKKFYYRYGDKKTKDFNSQVIMLHKIKAMMRRDLFRAYDGTNMTVRIA
jgi:superfamily II DNA or RNA helicase